MYRHALLMFKVYANCFVLCFFLALQDLENFSKKELLHSTGVPPPSAEHCSPQWGLASMGGVDKHRYTTHTHT